MSAGDDDDVGVGRKRRPLEPRRDVFDHNLDGVGEAFAVGELLTIVDDVHAEPDFMGQVREVEAHVARADDIQLGRWLDRLDVHAHLAAADEAGLLREVIVELVVQE